jgi:FtsZ-binding cell division protein ZapB
MARITLLKCIRFNFVVSRFLQEKSEALSREAKNDKYRISALEEEIESLKKQVKGLEEELCAANERVKASAKPPVAERPSSRSRQRTASREPKERARTNSKSESPRRNPPSPGRPLRFLKRRTRSKDELDDASSIPGTLVRDDESTSTNSKPKF